MMTETQLDWAVAKALGKAVKIINGKVHDAELLDMCVDGDTAFSPTRNWAQGGPLLERFMITVDKGADSLVGMVNTHMWREEVERPPVEGDFASVDFGTYLGAGMHALVQAKLGDNINFPEELK
jgi:hypothetical protein